MARRRDAEETAFHLNALLGSINKARISRQTIKRISGARLVHYRFVLRLRDELSDWGWGLHELASGGFGVVRIATLEGAKSINDRNITVDDASYATWVERGRPGPESPDDNDDEW